MAEEDTLIVDPEVGDEDIPEEQHIVDGTDDEGANNEANLVDMVRNAVVVEEPELPVDEMNVQQLIASFKKRKLTYGKDANETLVVLQTLITLYTEAEEWAEAERYVKILVEVKKTKLGSQHDDTIVLLRQLIDLQLKQQKHRVAALTLKSTTKSHETAFGVNHKLTLDLKKSYAACQYRHGKKDEAIALYRDILHSVVKLENDDNALGFGLGPRYKFDVLHPFMDILMAAKAYTEAEQISPEFIETSKQIHGATAPQTLNAMRNLAFIKVELKNFSEAESLYKEVVGLYATVYGDSDPKTLNVMLPYADIMYQMKKTTVGPALKAVGDLYVRILANLRVINDGSDVSEGLSERIFDTLSRLADIYTTLGDLENAERMLRQALLVEVYGSKHPKTVTTMFRLAEIISNHQQRQQIQTKGQAQSTEALTLYRRVLSSWKVIPSYGPVHPVTINALVILAERYYQHAMHFDAVELLERGLVACERSALGPDAPATLDMAFALAKMYRRTGCDLVATEALLKRVMEWRASQNMSPDAIESLRVSAEMGLVLMDMCRYAEALVVLRGALPGIERLVGLNHTETLAIMRGIGRCLLGPGMAHQQAVSADVASAVEIARLCLQRSEIAYGQSSTVALSSVAVLADALILDGKPDEAETILTQTIASCESDLGDNEVAAADIMHQLGKLHAVTAKHHLAKQFSSRALAIYSSVLGDDHETTRAVSAFVKDASTRLIEPVQEGE